MGMIEGATAATWTCPYYEVAIDLRFHSWILTTNSIDRVEQALLDRCRIVEIDHISEPHLLAAARRLASARLGEDAAELVVAEVRARLRRGRRMGLRQLARMIDAAEAAMMAPLLH